MRRIAFCVLLGAVAVAWVHAAGGKAPEDKRTVPELVRALSDELPYARTEAAKALGAKGAGALPAVLKALKDKDGKVRRGATEALAALGQDANSAAGPLAAALKDEDAWVRAGAAMALGKMGTLPEPAARALAGAVTDEDAWVREEAAGSLASATKDKDILLPAAVAAVRVPHSGWNVRRHAMGILWRYGRDHKPAEAALIELLEHPSEGMWDCSDRAVEMLIGLGAGGKAVPMLVKWLPWKNRGVGRRASASLAKIGKDAAAALPALKAMAEKDADKGNRKAATDAIEAIEAAMKKEGAK